MKLTEVFYDGRLRGVKFGGRTSRQRYEDEKADLARGGDIGQQRRDDRSSGDQAPPTNFFGRNGSRSPETRNGTFNIMINGKVWSKDGAPVSFSDMNRAASAVEKIKARMAERGQQGEVKVVNGAR